MLFSHKILHSSSHILQNLRKNCRYHLLDLSCRNFIFMINYIRTFRSQLLPGTFIAKSIQQYSIFRTGGLT
nr:MAG TPA: hypothetical protein [Caudoviricetes sp.]DAY96763.1 MAG TPA: hypothetical protein [Caudoviricetes sp.]